MPKSTPLIKVWSLLQWLLHTLSSAIFNLAWNGEANIIIAFYYIYFYLMGFQAVKKNSHQCV